MAIVGLNVAVYLVHRATEWMSPPFALALELLLRNDPQRVTHDLWIWQVMTGNFVHTHLLHLGVNMFLVLWLGSRLEGILHSSHFLLFYLASGAFAMASYDVYTSMQNEWVATAGASGCVLAILVLFSLRLPNESIHFYGVVLVPFRLIVLVFVISDFSCLLWPLELHGISHFVHLTGAAFGLVWWALMVRPLARA